MKRLILILVLVFMGCKTSKESLFNDKSKTDTFTEKKTVTRAGDTVTIDIPNIRYKDTTITKINYDTRTIASVRYDSQGNQTFDCISSELKELIETMKETTQNDIKSEEKKESEFNPQVFIWALAGLVFVIIIAVVIIMIAMAKIKKSIPDMILSLKK